MDQRRRDARRFIEEVRITNGGITPADREFLKKEGRLKILKAIYSLQEQLGASAKILSEQLYTKETRFVYELLQNAEDNRYPTNVNPSLSFTLQQDRIVIDSNESGFMENDILAISKVGMSTKTCQQGYIGEKGIGFKSVFKVARKVHVQSEPYSFAFEHPPSYQEDHVHDTGLGMVTPLNEEFLPVPDGVQTRIILYLRENCDRPKLREDFLGLPDTLLLFLKKLKELSVNIELSDYPHQHVTFALRSNEPGDPSNRVVIEKRVGDSVSRHIFLVKKRQISDMPSHPSRKDMYAEVVLAFPLDTDSADEVPLVEEHPIFAFLPLRKEGFKFLIQSDFITAANRQDVKECTWNDRLLEEVAKTFLHAIEDKDGFLTHPTIKYSWVRYIPTTSISHEFWGLLQSAIMSELCAQDLFYSRDDESWVRKPSELRVVTAKFRDDQSEPLLKDLACESAAAATAYVSENYDPQLDLPVMRKLGTINLSMFPDFLNRLKQDLDDSEESRWKTEDLRDDDWHTEVCVLLQEALKVPKEKEFIQKLNIIPLRDGKWVPPLNTSIFFPSSGGVNIPDDLPLSLVDGNALLNESRKALFISLGITECAPTRVFPLIEQRYIRVRSLTSFLLYQDIKFLFWHNDEVPTTDYSIYLSAYNGTDYHWETIASGSWLYSPDSEDHYSMFKLLNGKIPSELNGKIRFPSIEYYNILKECEARNNTTGSDWLRNRAGIKVAPQLCQRDNSSTMSAELTYIAEDLSQCLLGVLESNWLEYPKSNEWDAKMKATKVPILNCSEFRALETTFLPLPSLKSIAEELELSEAFGFLKELDGMTDVEAAKWHFLERFGVGWKGDVYFWLALLKQARRKENIEKHHVFKIYSHLQTFIEEKDVIALWEAFERDLIYIPTDASSTTWGWNFLQFCAWSGPEWFTHSHYNCLQHVSEYQPLQGFLVNTLQLGDIDLTDFLAYLMEIKVSKVYLTSKEEEAKISMLYEKLNELAEAESTGEAKDHIHSQMEENELVYDPIAQSWHSPSSCIWAEDRIQLHEKVSLATLYKAHASFFRQVLGIKRPSVEMHILSLAQKASDCPDKQSILQEMGNICALNPKPDYLWAKLSDCACFPARKPTGEIQWLSCFGNFAVVDRSEYGEMFRDKIMTLDFSLEEVHSLKSLLLSLRLEPKYLSNAVTEETRVEGGILNSELTDDLRRKAYAISRYAAHLGALDAAAAYSLLQRVKVFSSDSIARVVSIIQDRKTISIPADSAYFHVDQEGDQLRLYVPKSKRYQQVCLARQLPIRLLKHLGVQRCGKEAELGAIITASNLFVVDDILKQDGIVEVAGVIRPEDEPGDDTGASSNISLLASDLATISLTTLNSGRGAGYFPEGYYRPGNINASDDLFLTPATSLSPGPPEQPELYKELLDIAIQQAESIHGLPSVGNCVMASDATESTLDRYLAIRSSGPGEETFLIGAAGELFMYEFLKRLSLPRFDTSCWKSTIRHRVAVHSQYSTLTQLDEPEISDIVYTDSERALTEILIEQGYLERTSWIRSTPTYYIEVKTTMSALGNPFYCSQHQFDIMEEKQLPDHGASNEVYMIARVFGLRTSRMGLQLYLDPAKLRMENKLKFVANTYAITPSNTGRPSLG